MSTLQITSLLLTASLQSACPSASILMGGYCATNLVAILSNANDFFGRRTDTQGFLIINHEGARLVATRDDLEYEPNYTGLALIVSKGTDLGRLNGKKIRIRGVINDGKQLLPFPSVAVFTVETILPVVRYKTK
jgi:hypothetical protein